jgi:S-formylglutathione hydrolase
MWTLLDIAGKPAEVFAPPGSPPPRFGLLYLHDLDGRTLASSSTWTRLLEVHRLVCVCPHGKQSWWTDKTVAEYDPKQSTEAYLLDQLRPWYQAHYQIRPRPLALCGLGMGGQGALRLAFKHPLDFPVIAGIASALDCHELYGQGTPLDVLYDSKEQCRQDTALLHLHPTDYPPHLFFCVAPEQRFWYRGNDRLHEKLSALGIPHQYDFSTRAAGDAWSYAEQMAERVLAFLREGLDKEARRLL